MGNHLARSRKRAEAREEELRGLNWLAKKAQEAKEKLDSGFVQRNALVAGREALFLESFRKIAEETPLPAIKPYKQKKKGKPSRILNICLSDLHYGSDISARETGNSTYGTAEESRRTAYICSQVLGYKTHYRDRTKLIIHLIGDIIEGKLHDLQNAAPLGLQIRRAQWYLTQFIARCAESFPEVEVMCVPGNHGRNSHRHQERATNQKWDSNETYGIYWFLQGVFSSVKNVKINVFSTPYYRWTAFDKKGYATHGDNQLKVGYPNKAINVAAVAPKISKLQNEERCDMYLVGHVHIASCVTMDHGVELVTNGCLVPDGEFSQAEGYTGVTCAQQMWESVPGYIRGDHRTLRIDKSVDKDVSLDSIIVPFPGLVEADPKCIKLLNKASQD